MLMMLGVGAALGATAVAVAASATKRTLPGVQRYTVRGGGVSIVLIGANQSVLIEREVDRSTGSTGFSHVVIDASEVDDLGRRLVYDCFPLEGVRRVVLSERYGSAKGQPRPRVRVTLPPDAAEHMRGAMSALIGAPYDVAATVDPKRVGLVCSRLVMRGLTKDLASRVRPFCKRHPISPNDLARAFGVASPYSKDVQL